MKNIIFLGAPASGKGTHSNLLKETFGYMQISTGDLLREISSEDSELGRRIKNIIKQGDLVDDATVLNLLERKLQTVEGKPFILDGFPRNLSQTKSLNNLLQEMNVDYVVIYLDIAEELCRKRILGRLTCKCGKTYNLYTDLLPKKEGICDNCGSILEKRSDDTEESFHKRYKLFIENTLPILDYYKQNQKLVTIDANTSDTRDHLDIYHEITEVLK